ncbi:MAG: hypothetical protein LUC45_05890 [Paraprevotella sp.]|nr:hypothetical protein [Paraprevotella sp.]
MKKTILAICNLMIYCAAVQGKEDVTSAYLANPSFDEDAVDCTLNSNYAVSEGDEGLRGWNLSPKGWTATNPEKALLINAECSTDNNFGKTAAADGEFAYYQRFGWGSASSEMHQTTKAALPAGKYELKFFSKAFCANNAASSAVVTVSNSDNRALDKATVICAAGSTGIMGTSSWTENTLTFVLDKESPITISALMSWGNGGSCIAYDHFTLTELQAGEVDPDAPVIEGGTEDQLTSPTEGVITNDFVKEADMKQDLLQMLANSMQYARNIWYDCAAPNNKNEACGFFKANSAGNSQEDGVRTNADFSMICAFLYKYGQGKVTLPQGITWDTVKDMALKSLIFGYSTHKANKFKITSDNTYWGSVSSSDYVWESSLWTMSLAYASYFLDAELNTEQKGYIYNMIKAECNYELQRSIPTGYNGDTKAEENGWEADILSCALGLYPDDPLAQQWFDRLRQFAVNSYSQIDDANNTTVIDPDYDEKTIQDLYIGKNLYDDYTLQNHNYFHTSYQNVVMQELGEGYLALRLFQGEKPKWQTRALMHNNQAVMDNVLNYLALADGELAMPNGNDWSMFLYDQITSYATAACFLRDSNALMLENLAYKNIKARQSTTNDGSWLLNSDIGPRRMGVEGHRILMTYLMHEMASTSDLQPASWTEFSRAHEEARLFTSQNLVRANTPDRFSVFSWSSGLKSYTGYITSNKPDKNKIIVPYKANNTGNILGWYTVSGKSTDASPTLNGIYNLNGNSYTMNGKLQTNGNSLENNFTLYSTPGNAFVYMDYVVGKANGTITEEKGGLMAVSTDPFTKEKRTLYYDKGRVQTDGSQLKKLTGNWVNIDNEVGIVTTATDKSIAFGDRELNSSIYLSKIYPSYSIDGRTFANGTIVDRRHIIYYNNVDSATTARLAAQTRSLTDQVAEGWNGVIVSDPDSTHYLLLSNYLGETSCTLKNITTADGAPVFTETTAITDQGSTATFRCDVNHSIANTLRIFVKEAQLSARQMENDSCGAYLYNYSGKLQKAQIVIWADGKKLTAPVTIEDGTCVSVRAVNGEIRTETVNSEEYKETFKDVTSRFLVNPGFEEDQTYGTESNVTLNGVTYNPCYINTVSATDSRWPQVLPIQGWTPQNGLDAGSNYAVLYSMPYSRTMYCVSPSNVGNSASIMAAPAVADTCGLRCLSILNSWDSGSNGISQTFTLPKGEYKLSFLAQYVCNNEMRHIGDSVITTTGNNTNYSLCGVTFGNRKIFRYPRFANNWENLECTFTLDEATPVTVSMGLRTTAGVGAADNTRLYIDQVRLFSKDDITDGIADHLAQPTPSFVDVYNLQGIRLRSHVPVTQATTGLAKGVYIVGNKKTIQY